MPVPVYCISAPQDVAYLHALREHTAVLRGSGDLELHDHTTVLAGSQADDEETVARAQVVLVLLTARLFADQEAMARVGRALRRRQRVVPLRARPCDVEGSGLGRLVGLPKDGSWINSPDNDQAWLLVCEELRKLLGEVPAPGAAVAVLPPPPRCLGRDDDRRTLVAQLLDPAPSIVLGGAGLGKTTLIVSALHDPAVAAAYGRRRYFVRCDSATRRDGVVLEIARVLGVPLNPQLEPSVLARLREAPTLLALDNAETPWEADREAVEDLLETLASAAKLVLTLRGAERPGRVPFQPPLTPSRLTEEDARQLFLDIAGKKHAQDPLLARLVSAVDRLPLALTLLAHRAEPDPDLSTIWSEWQEQGTAAASRGQGRLDDLTRSLELSILGPRMRACPAAARLLSLLGLLPDGIARGDLEALLPGESRDAARTLRRVGLAFDEDLMLRVPAPVREHARRCCPLCKEDEARALSLYLTRATEFGRQVGRLGGAAAAARLSAESGNIEAVLDHALAQGRHDEALDALHGFGDFARFSGYQGRVVALLAQAAAESPVPHDRARCLFRLGHIAVVRSDHAEARACFDAALPLYQQVGKLLGEANCVHSLGRIALARAEHAEARARFDAALPLYQKVGDLLGQANCVQGLGDLALRRKDHAEARTCFDAALLLYRKVGALLGQANCIMSIGDLAVRRADHAEARTCFDAALPLFRQIGSLLGQANCIMSLGDLALRRKDHAEARARFGDALTLYQRVADPYSIGWTQIQLARLCDAPQGRRALAAAAFAAWRSIDRGDLVQPFAAEFPDAV